MRYALEVARTGSLNKASQILLVAQPNLSRFIKELEADLGIVIFDRSVKGMTVTPEGQEFLGYARNIIRQIDQVEGLYKNPAAPKQRFSISVPRACYISEAFAQFSRGLGEQPAELFYKETNSQRTIRNILEHDFSLGIIRYAQNYEQYFSALMEEKELHSEMICEFTYQLIMSAEHPLAQKEKIAFSDLRPYIEIAHADPYVPSLPLSRVVKEEQLGNVERHIFVYERASQFELLAENPQTFMWVSPPPQKILDRYGLVRRTCEDNQKVYRDVLVYRKGYRLTALDHAFITELCAAKRKYL